MAAPRRRELSGPGRPAVAPPAADAMQRRATTRDRGAPNARGEKPSKAKLRRMARTLYVRRRALRARRHTRSACDLYRECLELTPRDSYAWLALCKVMQRTNATAPEIRGTFAQADECNSVHIAHAWARFEEDEGHVEDARHLYERALTLGPRLGLCETRVGACSERKHNNPTRALEIFEGGTDQRGLLAVAAAETRFHGDERGLRDALLEVLGTSPSRHDAVAYRAFARVARSPGERCAALRRALEVDDSHAVRRRIV